MTEPLAPPAAKTVYRRVHPRLVLLEDWHRFQLQEKWIYEWQYRGELRRLEIPAGFTTDLASVPKLLHWWISPADLRAASLPHDLIYGYAGAVPGRYFTIDGRPSSQPWRRRDADRLFSRMMREEGVSRARRRAAYLAVRAFGWMIWRRAAKTKGERG